MAQKIIDIGTTGNDGTGDTIRLAGVKINDNFVEVYDFDAVKSEIKFSGNEIITESSNADIVLKTAGTGKILFGPGITLNDNNIEASRSNEDLIFSAAGTGAVTTPALRFNDNNIEGARTNDNINIMPTGTGVINMGSGIILDDNNIKTARSDDNLLLIPNGTGQVVIAGIGFSSGTTITATDSSSININENLLLDGTLNVLGASTFSSALALDLTTISITGLTTLTNLQNGGPSTFAGTTTIDNLTFNDNIISTSSNADLRLTPGGTGVVNVSNMTIDSSINLTDNILKVERSNDNLVLSANGSGSVEILSGMTTAAVTTIGNVDITGDKTISGQLDVEGLQIKDNKISTDESNANLLISGNSSGNVKIDDVDIGGGEIDGVVIGGTTPAAGTFSSLSISSNTISSSGVTITDNEITSILSNDNLEFTGSGTGSVKINSFVLPASDGATGQFIKTDGSFGMAFETVPIALGITGIEDAQTTIGFQTTTEQSPTTAVGSHESITSTESIVDEWDQTKYDSAWYFMLQRHATTDSSIQFSAFKTSLLQGTEDGSTFDAFDGTAQIVKSKNDDKVMNFSSDIRSAVSKVRLLGSAPLLADSSVAPETAVAFWRIGLGDNDSSGFNSGQAATIVVADLDSAASNLDTWSASSYRGAKYYISVNNTTTNEIQNSEVIVVHNGSDAFILEYNLLISNAESTPLATFTADISGGNVRLRGANGTAGTCRVTMYRIILADDESDASTTYEVVKGAQTVSNTATTTIDTNTFRGDVSPDMSSQKVINSFAKADFDSVWYHMIQKDITNTEFQMNKLSTNHGIDSDGSTVVAGVTDSAVVKTGAMTDITNFDVDLSGSTFQLKATAVTDGSTTIQNAISHYAIGLGDNTTTNTTGKISTHAGVTFGGANETRVDTITATGTCTSILNTQRTLAEFTTSAYDSAWFLGVSNDIENSGLATFKYSVMHGTTSDGSTQDAFITASSITRTDISHNHLETDADISDSNVRLLGNGGRLDDSSKSNSNTIAYYRIGLGDNDSSGYTSDDGNADTDVVTVGGIQETDIDRVTASGSHATLSSSGTTTCAEFTAGQYDGALFYVVNRDVANGSFETQKISLIHNLNDSFLTSSSVVSTDEGDAHPVYTTDIVTADDSTSKVRLRSTDSDGSTVSPSNTMAYYRIGLGDDDSTGHIGELGLVTDIVNTSIIDSTETTLNAFTHGPHVGAKYFITVVNQSTGETGNIEALVTHDGTDAYITTYNEVFSGNNSLINLSADINGTSLRLRGSATAGGSTKVIVNRVVAFGDSESDETNSDSTRKIIGNVIVSSAATAFDTFMSSETDAAHYVITGQKGSDENFICEAVVVTDGTNAYVSQGPNVSSKSTDMLEITAAVSSGVVTVSASSTSGASTVQAFAIKLKAPESSTSTIDTFSASSFRGAKYFISLNNLDSNEVSNIECLVVHDGTDAYINQYNEHFSGSASLINGDLTADISGGNVRLRCIVAQDNTRITFYKIILSDAESDITGGTNVNVIGDVTVSSTPTAIDTFVDTEVDGAHYVIIGYNASEAAASIQEANVITNGTGAFVSSGPYVSTKGTNQLDLTAAHDGSSTVTLSASSTSGGSTKVNAYRIHMKAPTGQTDNLDTFSTSSSRGAKYYISAKETVTGYISNIECLVVHDGTDAYINDFNEHFSHVSLVTLTTDISGGNVRLRCAGNIPDVKVKFYKIMLGDSESNAAGADSALMDTVTVSSTPTAIDTFVDTSHTGAHYVIVAHNSSEGSASISEATVLTDGVNAFVAQGPEVSSKDSHHLTLTAAHDGSNTVTLSASASSGGSTTVNAFRIHLLRGDSFSYDVIDSFAHADNQACNYIVVGKNASDESQIAELTVVTDGTSSYLLQEGANISTHSTSSMLMDFSTAVVGDNVELRAENNQENTDTTVNLYKVQLSRAAGNPSSIATLDSFSATTFRGAKYTVSISDSASGTLGLYETCDIAVTHDGSSAYLSIFGRVTNHTSDLVTFSADIDSGNVRLRGTISNTNTHTVTVVRRVMKN